MKLQEIFDQLATGELSQVSIGGNDVGVFDEKNWPRLVNHVNLGLSAIYKRFNLKTGSLRLQLQPGVEVYQLIAANAVSARRGNDIRYIVDSETDPFLDDVMKIENVWTEEDVPLEINNAANLWALSTPSATSLRLPRAFVFDELEIPEEFQTDYLRIGYRAGHRKIEIPIGYFDPARVEIELPYTHLEPLLLFVASRVQAPIGMGQEFNASNAYFARYEAACQELEMRGLQIDQGEQVSHFRRKGWA